ncbi:MAG: antibiotic biosynthesis monooxygenase family protein [Desulfatiglandales bacterium]
MINMMKMMVTVKLQDGKQKEFIQTFEFLKDDGETHQGLRGSQLNQEVDDKTCFTLIYLWESQEHLVRYLGSEEYKVLLGAIEVLGEKSQIRCEEISDVDYGTQTTPKDVAMEILMADKRKEQGH